MIQKVGGVNKGYSARDSNGKPSNHMNGQANRIRFLSYLQNKAKESSSDKEQHKKPVTDTVEISSEGQAFCEQEKQ